MDIYIYIYIYICTIILLIVMLIQGLLLEKIKLVVGKGLEVCIKRFNLKARYLTPWRVEITSANSKYKT
jgi:hypothetical protein